MVWQSLESSQTCESPISVVKSDGQTLADKFPCAKATVSLRFPSLVNMPPRADITRITAPEARCAQWGATNDYATTKSWPLEFALHVNPWKIYKT